MLITSVAAVLILLSGCGANTNGANSANGTESTKQATNSTVAKPTVFDFYNKVELGQTKDSIDALIAVTPTADTQVPNQYEYNDSKTGYGVAVLYDKNSKATGKTVIYSSHADIAPFCKKAVNKEQTDKITNGMTNEQVVQLLGGEGVEVGRYDLKLDGKVSFIRRWANSNGSCIQVTFGTDGKVNSSLFYEE